MIIGIIGAGLSGLVAGNILAEAGHEVTILEKSLEFGGKLATKRGGPQKRMKLDYGISHFATHAPEFIEFTDELREQDMVKEWTHYFGLYDGINLYRENPNKEFESYYMVPEGIHEIPQYLSRWVDIRSEVKAGGLTHIGSFRSKKHSWMINLTNSNVLEVDAVILASPAPQAYAVLQTAQNETAARRIIRHIDEINYTQTLTVMAGYGNQDQPDWKGIEFMDDRLWWAYNESSKRNNPPETALVLHSQDEFAKQHKREDAETIANLMLNRLGEIIGDWAAQPDWVETSHWRYMLADNPMEDPFIEMEMEEAPLALVGDYLGGNTVESAYLSGLKLANYWIEKYKNEPTDTNHAKPLL